MESDNANDRTGIPVNGGTRAGSGGKREVQVGRVTELLPKFGRLDSYAKKDGKLGASVLSEVDGAKYGVTKGVLERFSEIGSYPGWAYIDTARDVAFRFIVGNMGEHPEALFFIVGPNGRVGVPSWRRQNGHLEHGLLVAFYAHSVGPKQVADDVFPIDAEHLPLMARLIANGILQFPQHAEVVPVFMEALRRGDGIHPQDQATLSAALTRLASDPGVEPEFQRLARVEGGKLRSVDNRRVYRRPPPAAEPAHKPLGPEGENGSAQTGRNELLGDIHPRNLMLD